MYLFCHGKCRAMVRNKVLNATFNSISVIYRGGLYYLWREPEYPEKTTDQLQVTHKLYHIMRIHLAWAGFEPTVIGTGCIGSHKSNYHRITTTTAPMANIANDYIHISSLPGKRLIWVIDNEIWLYFPSCIKGTRKLTVVPIVHHRNTKFDCISHHAL